MEHLVKNHSQAPALTLLTVEGSQVGLGSHVRWGAHIEDPANFGFVDDLAEAEVYDDGVHVAIDDDVGRFEVAMQYVLFDEVCDGFHHFLEELHNVLLAHSLRLDMFGKGDSFVNFGDDIELVLLLDNLYQLEYVGMV